MDDPLVSFQALNSACYVLTESHSKEKLTTTDILKQVHNFSVF